MLIWLLNTTIQLSMFASLGLKIATTEEEAKDVQRNGTQSTPTSMFDVDDQYDAILAGLPQVIIIFHGPSVSS